MSLQEEKLGRGENDIDTCLQRPQREEGRLRAEEGGRRENQPHPHSSLVRENKSLCFKPLSL